MREYRIVPAGMLFIIPSRMKTDDLKLAERSEIHALRRSLLAFASMGVAGVVFSYLAESDAILLDGVYSFILCLMSLLGMMVARLVYKGNTQSHPFGYAAYEPTLNTLKGLIVLSVCVMALVSAIGALFHGGRDMAFGVGLIYSAGVTTACILIALRLKGEAKETGSPLLQVEARNWTVDATLSGGIGSAFLLGLVLSKTVGEHVAVYVDPVLTIILVIVIVPIPLKTVIEGLREILAMSPPKERVREIETRVKACLGDYPSRDFHLRVIKTGRSQYILVHVLAAQDAPPLDISVDDALRERLHAELVGDDPFCMVELVVTKDPRWAPGLSPR